MSLLKEKEINSPYDLKDMLWYIIPGATLLLAVFLFEYWFAIQICGGVGYDKGSSQEPRINLIKDSLTGEGNQFVLRIEKKEMKDSAQILKGNIKDSITIQKALRKVIHTPIFTALLLTHAKEEIFSDNWVFAAIYLLLILTVCYILGHITYIVGTFLYERGLVMKGYSYPFLKLLELPEHETKNKIEIEASHGFYTGVYFWLSSIYIAMYIVFTLWGYKRENYEIYKYGVLLAFIGSIIIPVRIKHILARITDWQKEKFEKKPKCKGFLYWLFCIILSTSLLYFFTYENRFSFTGFLPFILDNIVIISGIILGVILIVEIGIRWCLARSTFCVKFMRKQLRKYSEYRNENIILITKYDKEKFVYETFFIIIYNFIGNEIDKFSHNYFHTQTKFDQKFITEYDKAFKKVYNCHYYDLAKHNFWLSKFFVMENSNYLNQLANFWENNYRFTKSISASFVMAFLFCSLSFITQYREIRRILIDYCSWTDFRYDVIILFFIPIVFFVITILAIRYYLYVYDNRYSRMILRSFVSIVSSKGLSDKKQNEPQE